MTEQVVKSKNLRRQTKEWMAVFFTKCVRNIIDNAVSVCVITPQNRKLKKFQLHIIDQSFEHNSMGISYQKKLKALKRKRRCTLHASIVSRRICQHYTKGGPAGKLMWCERPRNHLNIQSSCSQNTGRAKTVTTLRMEECDFGHALGACTFYTSSLKKCQKTYRKTFWLLIF